MTEQLYYAYAVARVRPHMVPQLPQHGICANAPVTAYTDGDLLVLASPVPIDEFDAPMLERNLCDEAWLREHGLAHQRVVGTLAECYTVLPLQFCTLYRDLHDIRAMLETHKAILTSALDRLTGAQEWILNVSVDHAVLHAWSVEYSNDLDVVRAQIPRAPASTAILLRQKLERAADAAGQREANICLQVSHQQLAACSRAAVLDDIQPVPGPAAERILNSAYLVAEEQFDQFRSALAVVQERYSHRGFRYELTGPWPPYHFATLAK
jgi:hypothetical protein